MNAAIGGEDETIPQDTFVRLDGYLDNLAAAATTEHTTLATLIKNNATLMANVTSLTASLATLTSAYMLLAGQAAHTAPTAPKPANANARNCLDPTGYCWTHGYRVTKGHNSTTCKTPMEGHKTATTCNNTMGGSKANKSNAT